MHSNYLMEKKNTAKRITKVNQKQNLNFLEYENNVFDNIVKVLTETKLQLNKIKINRTRKDLIV